MAKATVWFHLCWSFDNDCNNDSEQTHTLDRWQFDAAHNLVKSSSKDYCGVPPESAYR